MCMGASSSKSDGSMTDSAKQMHRQNSPSTDDVGYVLGKQAERREGTSSAPAGKSLFSRSREMIAPVAASEKVQMNKERLIRNRSQIRSATSTSLTPKKRPKMLKAKNTISSLLSFSPTVRMFRHFGSRNDGI